MKNLKCIQLLVLLPVCVIGTAKSAVGYFGFPRPTGQYGIGTKVIELTDAYRQDPETKRDRRLIMQAWYPSSLLQSYDGTSPSEGNLDVPTYPYTYEMQRMLKKILAKASAKQEQVSQLASIRTHAIQDAQVLVKESPYPVVIFAHGYRTSRGGYSSLCEDIASHGYIVLMVMHTYITEITRFLDGSEVCTVRDRGFETIMNCYADIEFMLDNAQAGAFKELTHVCDFKNIGIVGHSIGGMMANHTCRMDSRIKAGISLDGPLFGPGAKEPPHKPFMFMLAETFNEMFGDEEGLKFANMSEEEFATCIDTFCQKNGANAHKLILKNSAHCTFSDCPILVNILKKILKTDDIHLGAGTIDGLIAIEIIRTLIINFFDKYLKGLPSALFDGNDTRYAEYVEFKNWV